APDHTLESLTEEPIDVLQAAQYRIEPDDGDDNDDNGSVTTQSDLADLASDGEIPTPAGKKRGRTASSAANTSAAKRPKRQVVNPADRRRQQALAAEEREKEARAAAEVKKRDGEERERQRLISEAAELVAAARSPEGRARAAAELEKKREKEAEEERLRVKRLERAHTTPKDIGGGSEVEMVEPSESDVDMPHPGVSKSASDTSFRSMAALRLLTTTTSISTPQIRPRPIDEVPLHSPNPAATDDEVPLHSPNPAATDDEDEEGNDWPPRRPLPVESDGEDPNAVDAPPSGERNEGDESEGEEGDESEGEEGDDEAPRRPPNTVPKPTLRRPRTQRQPETASIEPRRGRSAAVPRRGRSSVAAGRASGSSAPEVVIAQARPKPRRRKKP
ncbi:hypothetical protein C8F01DRAFT_1264714, partial [Mycena amicta]